MSKIKIFLWGMVSGVILLIIVVFLYTSYFPTTVYTVKDDIVLENGSVLSKGTKLTKELEIDPIVWNESLLFGITVKTDEINRYFKKEIDKRSNLIIMSPIKSKINKEKK